MINKLSKNGFIVCQILGHGSLQPVFSDDNGLIFFDTVAAAEAEIKDCIDSIAEAIKLKHMSKNSKETRKDYQILPATLTHETITASYDGVHYTMNQSEDDWTECQPEEDKAALVEFYADAVPEQWDDVEIEPVFDDAAGNVEPCKEGEESYWSIYLHDVTGGVKCVADCQNKETAAAFYNFFTKAIQNYKDNGHLNP